MPKRQEPERRPYPNSPLAPLLFPFEIADDIHKDITTRRVAYSTEASLLLAGAAAALSIGINVGIGAPGLADLGVHISPYLNTLLSHDGQEIARNIASVSEIVAGGFSALGAGLEVRHLFKRRKALQQYSRE